MANNYFLKNYIKTNNKNFKKKDLQQKINKEQINPEKKIAFQKLEIKETDLAIPKKKIAASYLVLIGLENAAKVIQHFNTDELIDIIGEILNIDTISKNVFLEVEKKFLVF